jgi:hypothetical protein
LPAPITAPIPGVDVAAPPATSRDTASDRGRPPTRGRRRGDDLDREGSKFAPAKFTPIQIADPLKLRRYQQFK